MSDRRTLTLAGLSFDLPTGWSTLTHGDALAFAPARGEANQAFIALPVQAEGDESLGATLDRIVATRLSAHTVEAAEPVSPMQLELAEGLSAVATGRRSTVGEARMWSLDVLIAGDGGLLYLSAFANEESTFNVLVSGRFQRVLASVRKAG